MDEQAFWNIIGRARAECGGDQKRQVDLIAEQLRALDVEEVVDFVRIFDAYQSRSSRTDLWNALNVIIAHRMGIIGYETGWNNFDHFRAWLIGEGRQVFAEVTQFPDHLQQFMNAGGNWKFEGLCYVGASVYGQHIWEGQTDVWEMLEERGDPPYPLVGWDWLQADVVRKSIFEKED